MLILKILDHDLHRARQEMAIPMAILVPDAKGHSPVLVSSTRGKFIVRRKLFQGSHPCGVFKYDSDRLDDIIVNITEAALQLSLDEKWANVFTKPGPAFDYIHQRAGTRGQPHACLVPTEWDDAKLGKWFGKDFEIAGGVATYRKTCRVHRCNTKVPAFFSRPDYVGLFTQVVGGNSSILLHNVRDGMSFCHGVPRKAG